MLGINATETWEVHEMLVTTKGRYALAALADLAERQGQGPVPLKDIAERQGISDKYLESIIKSLVKARLVTGARGKGGGYKLARAPEDISVLQVLEQVENEVAVVEGLDEDHAELPSAAHYRMLDMWRELDGQVRGYLGAKTIAELALPTDPGDYYVI